MEKKVYKKINKILKYFWEQFINNVLTQSTQKCSMWIFIITIHRFFFTTFESSPIFVCKYLKKIKFKLPSVQCLL